jgi:hypothetical protein
VANPERPPLNAAPQRHPTAIFGASGAGLRRAFDDHPLGTVVILGAALRLVTAIFSQGFLAVDDHHVLIDAAERLARGQGLEVAHHRSILYPGVVALVMRLLEALGDSAPNHQMLVIRLLQAAFSLLDIYFVYRILERIASQRAAVLGGLLVATCLVLPITSVHQFEETVCQVPLLAAVWWVLRAETGGRSATFAALSGLALGFALVLRFPLLPFAAPFALMVLSRPTLGWRRAPFVLGLVAVLTLQGFSNHLINHEWWYSFRSYYGPLVHWPPGVLAPQGSYPRGEPWTYVAALVGIFIPPFSFLLLAAAARGGARCPLLGFPTLTFLLAISMIANRQERFLLPVLPIIILLAALGFHGVETWFAQRSWAPAYRALWRYYWVVNSVLVVGAALVYGKKDRVAPLVFVQGRHDATGVVVAQYTYGFPVPAFYLGQPRPPLFVFEDKARVAQDAQAVRSVTPPANYLILYSDSVEVDEALLERALGARLRPDAVIGPSLGDELAHLVNPRRNHATSAVVFSLEPLAAAPH